MAEREWLIPLKERGHSGFCGMNFLFRAERVYVMDNHLAALWCWLQHLPPTGNLDLVHIDRHFDCLGANLDQLEQESLDVASLTLQDYLGREFKKGFGPLFSCQNFLSIFLRHYKERMGEVRMAVHPGRAAGDKPEIMHEEIPCVELPNRLIELLNREYHDLPTILDIDLDYFTCALEKEVVGQMFSVEYIDAIGRAIGQWAKSPFCLCITIALSPEWAGDWPEAERILARLGNAAGLDLRLPVNL